MKQTLPFLLFLFAPLCFFTAAAQTDPSCSNCRTLPICSLENNAIRFEYFGAVLQPNGNTQLKFNIANQSRFPLEYVSFELPGRNVPAAAPVASFISRYHYAVQNTYSDSLIKFTGLNTATYRYDQDDFFRYEVNTAQLNAAGNEVIRIQVKAGDILASAEFDLKTCADRKNKFLPLEVLAFKGAPTKEGVVLTWETSTAESNNSFAVQHSTDGSQFTDIGNGIAAGIAANPITHQFTHQQPEAGRNFYRLKRRNAEGNYQVSAIITVETKAVAKVAASEIELYPNPVTGNTFRIDLGSGSVSDAPIQVRVTDLEGRLVYEKEVSGRSDLQVNLPHRNPAPGIYQVRFLSPHFQAIRKLVIQ